MSSLFKQTITYGKFLFLNCGIIFA